MIQTSVVMIDEYNDKLPGYQTELNYIDSERKFEEDCG